MPISNSGRNSFAEETTMKSKQRESSITPYNIYLLNRIDYWVLEALTRLSKFFPGCSASLLVDFVARY